MWALGTHPGSGRVARTQGLRHLSDPISIFLFFLPSDDRQQSCLAIVLFCLFYTLIYFLCVSVCAHEFTCATGSKRESEDNLQEPFLSYLVGSGNGPQTIRIGDRHLFPLSQLVNRHERDESW